LCACAKSPAPDDSRQPADSARPHHDDPTVASAPHTLRGKHVLPLECLAVVREAGRASLPGRDDRRPECVDAFCALAAPAEIVNGRSARSAVQAPPAIAADSRGAFDG